MSLTPAHPFCLFSCLPLLLPSTLFHLHISLCHQESFLILSPVPKKIFIPQHIPPSSPSQDLSVLDSTSSLLTRYLLLSPVPVDCRISFISFIIYTHNSWIKTKGKPQIPSSCHEQQDKLKTSFPSTPGSLQSSKRALIEA